MSPPSHTAAPMRCSASAVTARLWFASSPECPCVAIGISAATARIATSSVDVQPRTANVRTVSTAPARVVSNHDCPSSVSTRKRPSCSPNRTSALSCALKMLMNVKKPVTPLATVKTAAETDAVSSATSNGRSPARKANSASTSEPIMPAADTLTKSFARGAPSG